MGGPLRAESREPRAADLPCLVLQDRADPSTCGATASPKVLRAQLHPWGWKGSGHRRGCLASVEQGSERWGPAVSWVRTVRGGRGEGPRY